MERVGVGLKMALYTLQAGMDTRHNRQTTASTVWQWQPKVVPIRVHNHQPTTISTPSPNPNPTTKQFVIVATQLHNSHVSYTYPQKFIRETVSMHGFNYFPWSMYLCPTASRY